MFKSARWRSEKNKIKVVFKLQLKATQVPPVGWDTMMVSLVPLDVGKPTVRSEKAAVVDGTCHWMNPIYETVKLIRDSKTGKINEKIYQFLVSATGSPKAGLLGEITINFAAYAEEVKPSSVSLPLKGSSAGVILHVTIQRMHADAEGREDDENGDKIVKKQRRTLKSQLSNCDKEDDNKVSNGSHYNNTVGEGSFVNSQAQMRFPSSRTMYLEAESNGNLRKSSSSDAISASGSDSSSGRYTPKENGTKNTITHQNSGSFLSPLGNIDIPGKTTTNLVKDYGDHQRSNTEWSPDGIMDGSTNSSGETGLREGLQDSDISLEKLRNDVVELARQVEVSELELQTLRKQVVKESRRGQDLLVELSNLKEERDAFRRECGELKALMKKTISENVSNKSLLDGEDPWSMLEEIKQELNHEKNLNANLRLQLQKTQESNSELILAVRDLDELLEQKNREISCLNCSTSPVQSQINEDFQEMKYGNGFSHLQNSESIQESFETISEHEDEEEYALGVLVKADGNAKVEYSLEQKIIDLNSEIELYRKDREDLEMQMEQLALDYEILKQKNHDTSSKLEQTQLREQLRMQYECSAHLSIINDLEAHVESLEKEFVKQAEAFEADLANITHAKVEQEQRAIRAEEALRKTRWRNANTAERLQEEFKSLSAQMSSTFYANEKLAMQALTEASELRLQKCHLEELLEKTNEQLASEQGRFQIKLRELSNQIDIKTEQIDKLLQKLKDKSEELQNQMKSEEARQKASKEEILVLKAEMERLSRERIHLLEQIEQKENLVAEAEQLKTSIKEIEMLLNDRSLERDMLEKELASVRTEAKKSLEELNELGHLKDEKERRIGVLNSEVATLRTEFSDLKHSLFEDEQEKENLRKQVFHLKGELRKKEDMITNIEKKLKDSNTRFAVSDAITKTTIRNKNRSGPAPHGSKEVATLREKVKLLEGDIQLKDGALEESKNSFLEKEKDLSNRIQELEKSMEEFGQNSPYLCDSIVQKDNLFKKQNGVPEDEKDISVKFGQPGVAHLQDVNDANKNFNTNDVTDNGLNLLQLEKGNKVCMNDRNRITREPTISTNGPVYQKKEDLISCTCDQGNITEVLRGMEVLKEKNDSMEAELKDMQERYSEISLKFAEVEGERQQLVMTIRTLKNALKN